MTAWDIRVNVSLPPVDPPGGDAVDVAALFGVASAPAEMLYRDLRLRVAAGELVAVVGHSGSGKTSLLRAVARRLPEAVALPDLSADERPAVACLDDARSPSDLPGRLEMLSRCGLAEATTLVTPARRLSAGQQFRLSLAAAMWSLRQDGPPGGRLLLIDEFASNLDALTAAALARRLRKSLTRHGAAALVSTPRADLLGELDPDRVIVKPLGEPARVLERPSAGWPGRPPVCPQQWSIEAGSIADYRVLGRLHYLSGPPRGNKRVWTVRVPADVRGPAGPEVAAVLVVSPPVALCRGRNLATSGRYAGSDRAEAIARLNREVETIARVVVHPIFRGCGLAVRLVRHALDRAGTPLVEAMAAMGAVHPFFELAQMTPYRLPATRHAARLLSAADAAGLSARDVAAIEPVRRIRTGQAPASAADCPGQCDPLASLLRTEFARFVAAAFTDARRRRLAAAGQEALLAEACRAATAAPVYYLARAPEYPAPR